MFFFLISATLNFSKTRGSSMWKYAKVEMKPPSFDEFPQIKQSINNIIVGAKTQKFMKMPVKVISQQSRFLAHLDKGPCKLFSSLDLRSPESKVHMRKCHHYDCRLKTFTFQSSSPKNHWVQLKQNMIGMFIESFSTACFFLFLSEIYRNKSPQGAKKGCFLFLYVEGLFSNQLWWFFYPLANEVARGYSNATVRPSQSLWTL